MDAIGGEINKEDAMISREGRMRLADKGKDTRGRRTVEDVLGREKFVRSAQDDRLVSVARIHVFGTFEKMTYSEDIESQLRKFDLVGEVTNEDGLFDVGSCELTDREGTRSQSM